MLCPLPLILLSPQSVHGSAPPSMSLSSIRLQHISGADNLVLILQPEGFAALVVLTTLVMGLLDAATSHWRRF